MKKCLQCNEEKPISEFYKRGLVYYSPCKKCWRKKVKERYSNPLYKEKIKQYEYRRARNPIRKNKQKLYRLVWSKNNPELKKKIQKAYRDKCKLLGIKQWSEEGKIKSNKNAILRYHQKYKFNPQFRLALSLRNRTGQAIKSNQKSGSAVNDLGCTIQELKKFLENKFVKGMSWDNIGKWHIDHIRPLKSFNLTIRKEYLKAVNFTNLQPLWAIDNLKKGSIDEISKALDIPAM